MIAQNSLIRRAVTRSAIFIIFIVFCFASVAVVEEVSHAQRRITVRGGKSNVTKSSQTTKRNQQEKEREREARRRAAQGKGPLRKGSDGEIIGVPSVGEIGIQKSTAELMSEQAANKKLLRRPRLVPEREIPNRRERPQDPKSLPLASSPNNISPNQLAASVRGPREAAPAAAAPQTLSTNFNAVTGPTETGAFPPDTMGAVGPSQFFVFLNGRLRTFTKAGAADGVINVDPDVFFSSVMTPPPAPLAINFTSDPQVRYDRLTARWFLLIIDVPSANDIGDKPNRILIAVSDAASAGVITGGTVWTFYFVQQNTVGGGDTGGFCDYPSLGVDANALYTGCDEFDAALGGFNNTTAFVIQKSSVLSGGPVVTTAFRDLIGTDGPFEPRGVDNVNPASTEGYFIGASAAAFGRLIVRRVANPGGVPTMSANVSITVAATSFPRSVDHLGDTGGTAGNVDALDDRLMQAHIRNGRLWTSHSISVTSTGAASGTDAQRRDAVRWYELVVPPGAGAITVNQSGTIFDSAATLVAARQYFIPSITVSGQGHAALGYTTGGTPFRLDAATNGRLIGDALGTLGAVNIYTASSTAYNPPADPGPTRRWGDYSFVSLDPLDDMTMWTIQQYCNGTNTYGTRVVKLLAPPPATPTTAAPANVAAGQASVNVVITGTSVSGSGFFDPGANLAAPALPFTHIAASVTGGVTVNSVTFTDATHVTLDLNTTAASPGPKDVTITNPDGQNATGIGVLNVGAAVVPTAGQVLISEFRFRGTGGAADEYVELYNNLDNPADISGFSLHALTAAGAQNLRFIVPGALGSSTTVIPARGHFLITGASYSLPDASNGALTTGIVDGSSVGFFAGATPTAGTRIDSAGFDTRDALFFEGTPITPSGAGTGGIIVNGEYAFVRKMTTASGGIPQDTGNNQSDFAFVSTDGGIYSTRQSTLGAPGPENLASPIVRNTLGFALLDPSLASSSSPNRVRNLTPHGCNGGAAPSNCTFGTMTVRRSFTNNTAAPITRLRFRIVDVTTFPSPSGGVAELRALDSGSAVVTVNSLPVTVEGTSIETPPAQTLGGGQNSSYARSLVAGTIINTAIAPGQTVHIQFVLGVQNSGSFRFLVNLEALP